MDKPTEYAQVFTDGGGDPTFAELDGFLFTGFNARASTSATSRSRLRDTEREAMLLIEPERCRGSGPSRQANVVRRGPGMADAP